MAPSTQTSIDNLHDATRQALLDCLHDGASLAVGDFHLCALVCVLPHPCLKSQSPAAQLEPVSYQ